MAEVFIDHSTGSNTPRGIFAPLNTVMTWWALMGGAVFLALVLMSIVSIVGRKLFSAPVTGDMELLMMGAAVGSAAFLPLCEMDDYHVRIDAFTAWASERTRAVLDVVAHGLICLVAALFTWRTALYAMDARQYNETSTLLQIPLWMPVALLVPSFILLGLAALYRMKVSLCMAVRGKA